MEANHGEGRWSVYFYKNTKGKESERQLVETFFFLLKQKKAVIKLSF